MFIHRFVNLHLAFALTSIFYFQIDIVATSLTNELASLLGYNSISDASRPRKPHFLYAKKRQAKSAL